jgi:phosphoglycolate phosphatase
MPPESPWSCILWDVDGTIVDASDGILHRLTVTLEHFGRPAPTRAELVHWIGPPMFDSFQAQAGMDAELAATAVAWYRELGRAEGYATGARLFPGVAELIHDLDRAGVPQATASSKPERQVHVLMEHFGLAPAFATMAGATPDERTLATKADIVAEALRRLRIDGIDISRPVLVGDRHHDVDGGAVHGVPVIFVRWGFSWPHESEGASAVADDIHDLRALLLPAASDDPTRP